MKEYTTEKEVSDALREAINKIFSKKQEPVTLTSMAEFLTRNHFKVLDLMAENGLVKDRSGKEVGTYTSTYDGKDWRCNFKPNTPLEYILVDVTIPNVKEES